MDAKKQELTIKKLRQELEEAKAFNEKLKVQIIKLHKINKRNGFALLTEYKELMEKNIDQSLDFMMNRFINYNSKRMKLYKPKFHLEDSDEESYEESEDESVSDCDRNSDSDRDSESDEDSDEESDHEIEIEV